jgi:hypothetical protein
MLSYFTEALRRLHRIWNNGPTVQDLDLAPCVYTCVEADGVFDTIDHVNHRKSQSTYIVIERDPSCSALWEWRALPPEGCTL